MTDLTIGRLSATVHGDGNLAPRLDRMLTQLAQRRLDEALQAADLPSGEWCVRRVDVGIVIDPTRPDGAIETQWAAAVVDALNRALRTGSGDVVHYRRHTDALTDLVVSVATGWTERAWAWRRIGLLAPDDPPPESAPADAVLAVLRRHPTEVLAVLIRATRDVGIAALHRLFGARGWVGLARLLRPGFKAVETGSPQTAPGNPAGPRVVGGLTAELIGRSTLAEAFGRSRLRADPVTAQAWAVLITAEADLTMLLRPVAAAVIDEVTHILAGGPRPPAIVHRLTEPGEATPTELDRESEREGAGTDAQRASRRTLWAGLLFLINTAAEAGVPDVVLDDPVLAARTLPWLLHGIARRLVPAAQDDPAVLAFAGLAHPPTGTASDVEDRCLHTHAHRWAEATAARLDRADEDPQAVVAELARRRGEITAEPGWVEVLLPLAEVDIDVRRAGLDIDPGWVRWLGTVVRFGYA